MGARAARRPEARSWSFCTLTSGAVAGRGGRRRPGLPRRLPARQPDHDPLDDVDQQPAPTPPARGQQQLGRRLVGLVQRRGAAAVRAAGGREPVERRKPRKARLGEVDRRPRWCLVGSTAGPGRRCRPQVAASRGVRRHAQCSEPAATLQPPRIPNPIGPNSLPIRSPSVIGPLDRRDLSSKTNAIARATHRYGCRPRGCLAEPSRPVPPVG